MAKTKIEWTDEVWNPLTGCTRVSPGCDHCYMFALYPRLKGMDVRGYEESPDILTLLPGRLDQPLKWMKPRKVFVNSMSDLFHSDVPFEFITRVFDVMYQASVQRGHIFQVLTKRPGRAAGWWEKYRDRYDGMWPSGVWLGTSVETQKYAPRIKVLARVPAAVRFISAEPLLGPLNLGPFMETCDSSSRPALDWIIVGGESGVGARPMEMEWARSLRDQAIRYGVPFFLKQLGGVRDKRSNDKALLDGRLWNDSPSMSRPQISPSIPQKRLAGI